MGFNLADVLKDVPKLDTEREQITYLPLDKLQSDEGNFYSLQNLDQLADNISVVGLQQPIRVRDAGDGYKIVSGHRRTAAIRILAKADPEKWKTVPCIIEREAGSEALQQLRLIYANANTRQLSSAEISEQAQQVERLLYQLQEEGYSFPGRMRDHVAEAVGASRSKLARLKVIRDRLIPEFTESWKTEKISESTAYTLAQASPERQRLIFEAQGKDSVGKLVWLSESTMQNCLREMDKARAVCDGTTCFRGCACDHTAIREKQAAGLRPYSALNCRGCCRDCSNLAGCRQSCEYAGDVKRDRLADRKAKKAEIKAAEDRRMAENDAKKAAAVALAAEIFRRTEALRVERKIPVDDLVATWAPYALDYCIQRYERCAAGKEPDLHTGLLPGGISPIAARQLVATAEKLGCSVDYLLGRDVSGATAAPATAWRKGNPADAGQYAIVWRFQWEDPDEINVEAAYWSGRGWIVHSMPILEEMVVVGWADMPEGI